MKLFRARVFSPVDDPFATDAAKSYVYYDDGYLAIDGDRCLLMLRQRPEPADGCIGVVRARVHDGGLPVLVQCVRIRRRTAERPVEHDHARQPELVAEPVDRGRDRAEVLRDQRQLPESALDSAEELGARSTPRIPP